MTAPGTTLIENARTAGDAAAMWWVNVLQNPKLDNGDTSEIGAMTALLGMMSQRPQPIDGLEAFAVILSEKLNEQLKEPDGYVSRYGISLGVDYDPDLTLRECAERAGLRLGMGSWPWKTHMWVKPDEVTVSYGYRAEPQVIWSKKG